MQALAGIADKRREALLDVEVHILIVEVPVETAGLDLAGYRGHTLFDRREVCGRDDGLARQHAGMRQRCADVLPPHPAVEEYRSSVSLDQIGNGLGKAPRPGGLGRLGGGRFRRAHDGVAVASGKRCG
jgi:hypothetical protein